MSLGKEMAFCTVVDFEFEGPEGRAAFEAAMSSIGIEGPPATGRLSRIVGLEETGAHVVEVWGTADEARRFAEAAGPLLAQVSFPAPSRVSAFEVTTYDVA
jgi:hypothetical protein